ncbi:hypothetical protein ACQP1W_24405 [Spirillospora sp. CA-255316]
MTTNTGVQDVIHWPEGNAAAHFAAMDAPGLPAREIRTFFGKVR